MKFKKQWMILKGKRLQKLVLSMLLFLIALLVSCKTLKPSPKVEIVPVTRDLSFPEVPDIHADTPSDLTQEEYEAMVHYIIEAEKIFNIIAVREDFLATYNTYPN